MSGFFHTHLKNGENVSRPKASKSDCPVMSGFFHALLDALEESLNDVLDSIPTVVIAQLCRAFFMHPDGCGSGQGQNGLIAVIARLCRAFFMHRVLMQSQAMFGRVKVIARLCRAFFIHF